ncbi:DNA translocase FtsK [uncultured Anaerococcus sp.]|uniref:DNA translocase FtsK n=1 Tax=uncultured Anaerococcus sp. TaxID=293428 RepID=UPI00288C352D|nr:DNA translocase FtsK [uncultured Anaerococcus sp.]
MTNRNSGRIRKKSNIKSPNKSKQIKFRERSFDLKRFSMMVMVASTLIFIFILSSSTGLIGYTLARFFESVFGKLSLAFPILLFASFYLVYREKFRSNLNRMLLIYGIYLLTLAILSKDYIRNELAWSVEYSAFKGNLGGGWVGGLVGFYTLSFIGHVGLYILYITLIGSLIINVSPYTYKEFFLKMRDGLIILGLGINHLSQKAYLNIRKKIAESKARKAKENKKEDKIPSLRINNSSAQNPPRKAIKKSLIKTEESEDKKISVKDREDEKLIRDYKSKQVEFADLNYDLKREFANYSYPSINLLKDINADGGIDNSEIRQKAEIIEETLESFGIEGKIVQIDVGPTVTCYELKPARGVKVSKIVNLADDLSLSLATSGIRIEAPIPGKSHVGIEVANDKKEVVGFKEIISSTRFIKTRYAIPFAMGKSISGEPIISGIEKMPHLLVSGATGSGKSVCINTIIMSILYKHSPDEVKLLLIDPKVVELSIYNGIPHLIMPVITDPKKASSSLFWAISEMERRYKLFEENHVRDIKGYKRAAETDDSMENLPYIVVIVDELSDLMMTAASEVEDYITRLAQKSRACGIHLIIATQRPTVDVITGTIKANIPSRISFAVTSQIDSRTILDMQGAEKLLGKGDMLYASSDSMKPLRIQGAFVSDEEVLNVVEYIKGNSQTSYNEEAIEKVEENVSADIEDEDELLDEAIRVIVAEQTASVSMLQRKLKIGYARAGRIIDQLEQKGIVGGYEGSKPRRVLVDRTYFEN